MKTQEIQPADAKNGDQVYIKMKRKKDGSRSADRTGTVTSNDADEKSLDLMGDNFVSISVGYARIDKIDRIIADKL